MSNDVIEGVDYIFDRYAFIGVAEDADKAAISAALRAKRAENHPERLVKAGPEVLATAEAIMNKVAECDRLLDPDWRVKFDARLAWFKAELPMGISKDGHVLVVMGRPKFDLQIMLGGEAPDDREHMGMVVAVTGYKPGETDKLFKMAATMPDNEDVREMLKDALHRELAYLKFKEESVWEGVGISGQKSTVGREHLFDARSYTSRVDHELGRIINEDLPERLEAMGEAMALGFKTPLLLAGPETAAPVHNPQAVTTMDMANKANMLARIAEVMAGRREKVLEIARKKQQVLLELAQMQPLQWLTPKPGEAGDFVLFLLARKEGEEPFVGVVFEGNDLTMQVKGADEHPFMLMKASELGEQSFNTDAMAVEIDWELEHPLLVLGSAIGKRRMALGLTPSDP